MCAVREIPKARIWDFRSMANGNFLCLQCNKIYATKSNAVRLYKTAQKKMYKVSFMPTEVLT